MCNLFFTVKSAPALILFTRAVNLYLSHIILAGPVVQGYRRLFINKSRKVLVLMYTRGR